MKLFSITFTSSRPELMTDFYRRLGFEFEKKSVRNGSFYYRAQFNGMELVIYNSNDSKVYTKMALIPRLQVSIVVEDMGSVLSSLSEIQISPNCDPIEIDGRIHAVITDPEGYSVELIQNGRVESAA